MTHRVLYPSACPCVRHQRKDIAAFHADVPVEVRHRLPRHDAQLPLLLPFSLSSILTFSRLFAPLPLLSRGTRAAFIGIEALPLPLRVLLLDPCSVQHTGRALRNFFVLNRLPRPWSEICSSLEEREFRGMKRNREDPARLSLPRRPEESGSLHTIETVCSLARSVWHVCEAW